jgi:hypothetical protein
MEEQRKATIRDRFSAASKAVAIGSAGYIIGTALLYRSYVRDLISPPKKTGSDIDWKTLGQEILTATMPILAKTFAEVTRREGNLHGHPEGFECGEPDCCCHFPDDTPDDTLH